MGLQTWIPLYMTGQVTPYYLKGVQNDVYCHANLVSEPAALFGECIKGHVADGMHYLTRKKDEVEYYRHKADLILEKASPLMHIYNADDRKAYEVFALRQASTPCVRKSIMPSPPLYTIPDGLLGSMLERHHVSGEVRATIESSVATRRDFMELLLARSQNHDLIADRRGPLFVDEDHPVRLDLAPTFVEADVPYTPEEYEGHIAALEDFSARHPNYSYEFTERHLYENIRMVIYKNDCVILSKYKAPAIHFVIDHPQLCKALENMAHAIID